MRCPHCEYEYEYDYSEGKGTGNSGDFFYSSKAKMNRTISTTLGHAVEKIDLFGCPVCKKVFLD